MLKWQATLHTQENSEGLHDIHWRCELLSQGGLAQFIVWMWKRSQSLTVDGIEAKQLSRTGVSSVYVTSESSVLCLIGRNRRCDSVRFPSQALSKACSNGGLKLGPDAFILSSPAKSRLLPDFDSIIGTAQARVEPRLFLAEWLIFNFCINRLPVLIVNRWLNRGEFERQAAE